MDYASIPLDKQIEDSVHLERKQSIVIECSNHKYIKHKKTSIKKKFLQASEITFKNKKSLQRRNELAQNISDEICKLRLASPASNRKRSIGIQSSLQPLGSEAINPTLSGVDFTIEKFSSEHKFVCTSPRYSRDEQTKCRPRMRTIGMQKNPHNEILEQLNAEHKQPTVMAAVDGEKKSKMHLPFCCFDYDIKSKAIDVYHQNQCSQNVSHGRCCYNYNNGACQNHKMPIKCNGCVCNNKRHYIQRNLSPYREYSYCCDEYYYDCPCSGPMCCTRTDQAVPSTTVPNPPMNYCRCSQLRNTQQYTYNRRCSDLNTKEFFQANCDTYRTTKMHKPRKDAKFMEKYMLSLLKSSRKYNKNMQQQQNGDEIPKQETKATQIEDRQPRKNSRQQEWEGKLNERLEKVEKVAKLFEEKLKNIPDDRSLSQSSDEGTSLSKYKVTSKQKLFKFTAKRNPRNSSTFSGNEFDGYDTSGAEYSQETLRALKHMRITEYKPSKLRNIKSEKQDESLNKNTIINNNNNNDRYENGNGNDETRNSQTQKETESGQNSQQAQSNANVKNLMSEASLDMPKSESKNYNIDREKRIHLNEADAQKLEQNGEYVQATRELFESKPISEYNQLPEAKLKILTANELNKSNNKLAENLSGLENSSHTNGLPEQTENRNDALIVKTEKNIESAEEFKVGSNESVNHSDLSNGKAFDVIRSNDNNNKINIPQEFSQNENNKIRRDIKQEQIIFPVKTDQIIPNNKINIPQEFNQNENNKMRRDIKQEQIILPVKTDQILSQIDSTAIPSKLVTPSYDNRVQNSKERFNNAFEHNDELNVNAIKQNNRKQNLKEELNGSFEHNGELNLSGIKLNKEIKEMNGRPIVFNSKMDLHEHNSKNLERILSSVSRTNSYTSSYSIDSWNSCKSCIEVDCNPCTEENDDVPLPQFTGCPCMMKTYLKMLSIYCGNDTTDKAPYTANRCD